MEITAISDEKRHLKDQIEKIHGYQQEKEFGENLLGIGDRIGCKLSDVFRGKKGLSCGYHPNKNHDNGNDKEEKDEEGFGCPIIDGDFRENATEYISLKADKKKTCQRVKIHDKILEEREPFLAKISLKSLAMRLSIIFPPRRFQRKGAAIEGAYWDLCSNPKDERFCLR